MSQSKNFPPPPQDGDATYGEDYFHTSYEKGPSFRQRQEMYRQERLRIGSLVRRGRVLDYGCGMGDFLLLFDPAEWERYGFDISEYAMAGASARGIRTTPPDNPNDFFDVIILRGCLQHLDEPIGTLRKCVGWLKPGGLLVFLATPDAGSICYRLFQDLPALDPPRNFVVFSAKMLRQCLSNLGMEEIRFEHPYRRTPYARPAHDLVRFVLRCAGVPGRFAFWGNMMECYARKPLPG